MPGGEQTFLYANAYLRNICSYWDRTHVPNIRSYNKRTYVLYALNDAPCLPRMLFVKIAKNPAESLALCTRVFVKFLLTFRV